MSRIRKQPIPDEPFTMAAFFNLLGSRIFGKDWSQAMVKRETKTDDELVNSAIDRSHFMALLVEQQLLAALRNGLIVSRLGPLSPETSKTLVQEIEKWDLVKQRAFHKAEKKRARDRGMSVEALHGKVLEDEVDEVEIDELETAYGSRRDRAFLGLVAFSPRKHYKARAWKEPLMLKIAAEYWQQPSSHQSLSRTEDTAIPITYLTIEASKNGPFEKAVGLGPVPLRSKCLVGQIWVRKPRDAYGNHIWWPRADDIERWGNAYHQYSRKFWPEIIAVSWRLIAFSVPTPLTAEDLLRGIKDYLNEQGELQSLPAHLQVSDESLRILALNILRQFKRREEALLEPVIVNQGRR